MPAPPSVPAMWFARRVLLPLSRKRVPILYFCFEPPRFVYSDTAEVAARIWDLSPDGKQTLISRGVYRLAGTPTAPSGPIAFELSANAWLVPAGDKLKLEVTGADAPYFQVDSIPSVTNVSAASVELPVAEGPPAQAAASAPAASVSPARASAPSASLPATGGNGARAGALGAALLAGALALRRLRRRASGLG